MCELETGNWVQIQILFLHPRLNLLQLRETQFPTDRWRIRLFLSLSDGHFLNLLTWDPENEEFPEVGMGVGEGISLFSCLELLPESY